MPISIRCHDKLPDRRQTLRCEGVCAFAQRVIQTGNDRSAAYADQSNHCYAAQGRAPGKGGKGS